MGEKGVGKLSQGTPPPREGEPMGVLFYMMQCRRFNPLLSLRRGDFSLGVNMSTESIP